jgi:short-subunit dehydrogenase
LARSNIERIALVDRDLDRLGPCVDEVRAAGSDALPYAVDLRDTDQIGGWMKEVDQQLGGVDLLINNAAILGGEPLFPDTPFERNKAVVEVNLLAVIATTQSALQIMRTRKRGTILNIVSGSAFSPYAEEAVYASTKAAVVHFTRCCSTIAAQTGVTVKGFAPPLTATGIFLDPHGHLPDWLSLRIKHGAEVFAPEDVGAQIVRFALQTETNGEVRMFRPSEVAELS